MSPSQITLAVVCTLSCLNAVADEAPAITPYRPSVSSPAALSAVGQVELELGGLRSSTDGQTRDSLPYLLKLALNPDWAILFGGEAIVRTQDGSSKLRGIGDTLVTLKRSLPVDDLSAFGVELSRKIPTAKSGIGSDAADTIINGIYSRDFGGVHMDANLNFTRIGGLTDDSSNTQTGVSASFSTSLNEQFSLTGELSGTHRSGAPNTRQALVAVAYSPSKRLTLDIGASKGLNNTTQDWSVFAGVVIPVGKVW